MPEDITRDALPPETEDTDSALKQEQCREDTLQFQQFQHNFPQYSKIEEVPGQVTEIAKSNGITLFDAMLRYEYEQKKSAQQELARQEQNRRNGLGAFVCAENNDSEDYSALMRGIWG